MSGVGQIQVAELWQRLVARCIDAAIGVMVISMPLVAGVFARTPMMFLLAPILYLAFAVFYEWLFIGLDGATPGKAAVQIKVVDEISGGTIGLGRAFVRHLIILGPLLLPYLGLVVCFVVLLSPLFDSSGRSQGWHDKIAKDLVVKR